MHLAYIKVQSLASSYLFQRIDINHFREGWPRSLSTELEALDIPTHLVQYLPQRTQSRGIEILNMFHNIYYEIQGTDRDEIEQIWATLGECHKIFETIDELGIDLEKAHRGTIER